MNGYEWEVVLETFGPLDADIVVGRLQAEGIPARAFGESAGRSFGIMIGKLGTVRVEVPTDFVDKALEIIGSDFSEEIDDDAFYEGDDEDLVEV